MMAEPPKRNGRRSITPAEYHAVTDEVFRVPLQLLYDTPALYNLCEEWVIQNIMRKPGLDLERVHWQQRLDQYLETWSKHGTHVEVSEVEYDLLADLNAWLSQQSAQKPYYD